MPATQQPPGALPSISAPSSPWRKRPAELYESMSLRPEKRPKHLAVTASDHTTSEPRQEAASAPPSSMRGTAMTRVGAERWFDDTNEHPEDVSFVDDDPPYYLQNHTSDYNSACATQSENSTHNAPRIGPTAPTHARLAQMDVDNDHGDVFRGVIDDLTVQNKKLRRKLRKYETLHCSHLQEEKLFEVRIHGLDANRKRQLEEALRSFASGIEGDSPRGHSGAEGYPAIPEEPPLLPHKTSSASTSISKQPLDSAYASMSGQTGASLPHHPPEHDLHEKESRSNRQNVKSYLHDIPEVLAPKSSLAMSDTSKSKVVVRRLEQLFTGKGAASFQHRQSHQQQEVSQSAAQAERKSEASGQPRGREGTREAHILSDDAQLQVDSMEDVLAMVQRTAASREQSRPPTADMASMSSSRGTEQRPTRPLDLDLHRAQIPSDNMEYIRHLGLAEPTADQDRSSESEDGWLYLNLLTGMAQLHTLNVTPEFVRKAVAEVSAKFELSPDQTKVRWLGGTDGSRMSSDGEESEEQMNGNPSERGRSANNRGLHPYSLSRGDVHEQNSTDLHRVRDSLKPLEIGAKRRPVDLKDSEIDDSSLQYRPLFFHTAISEDGDGSGMDSDSHTSSGSPDFTTEILSGSKALHDRQAKLRGRRREHGPIIFYNRARFCTDLSGDPQGSSHMKTAYCRFSSHPIGCDDDWRDDSHDSDADDAQAYSGQQSASDVDMDSTRSVLDLDDLRSVITDYASSRSGTPLEMEASGLGGIQPEDNFVLNVQIQHENAKTGGQSKPSPVPSPRTRPLAILRNVQRGSLNSVRRNVEIPRSNGQQGAVNSEIVSTVRTDMSPSALPPPSYACLPFDSDSDSDSSGFSAASMTLPHHSAPRRRPSFERANTRESRFSNVTTSYRPADERYLNDHPSTESSVSESDDDSSIDLLAHARGLDPETIAAREREFESNNGRDDLAEIPAGSSAATNGGGSGKASPDVRRGGGEGNSSDDDGADSISVSDSADDDMSD